MVSVVRGANNNNHDSDAYGGQPKTLCEWVRYFRIKRMEMKRKLRSGGDLRVCAILSTALMSAELKLKRKQQERFQRWLTFQNRIWATTPNIPSNDAPNLVQQIHADSNNINNISNNISSDVDVNVVDKEEREEEQNRSEYNSARNNYDGIHRSINNNNNIEEAYDDDDNCQKQQDNEVTNLWKSELVELDKFMRSISNMNRNDFREKECASNANDEDQPRRIQVFS